MIKTLMTKIREFVTRGVTVLFKLPMSKAGCLAGSV
jgi:hypothetical protein